MAWYTKAEVGVVFPVNTELQRVGGEGFSDGYAEKQPRFKTQNGARLSPHTSPSLLLEPNWLFFLFLLPFIYLFLDIRLFHEQILII